MSHGQTGAAGVEHKPHVLPLRIYFAVAAALLVLTWLTVYVSFFDFGMLNIVVALGVATVKASLVTLFFMHLKYDERFNALVFVSAFAFLSLFFIFTLSDLTRRGEVDPIEAGTIKVLPESSIPAEHHEEEGHGAEGGTLGRGEAEEDTTADH